MMTWRSTALRLALWLGAGCAATAACGKAREPRLHDTSAQAAGATEEISFDVGRLPASTQVIVQADVSALAASPLAARLIDRALSRDPETRARLDGLLARCHLEVTRDVRRVTLAMRRQAEVALIAEGRFDEPALVGCIRAETGDLAQSRRDGQQIYATTGDPNRVWLTVAPGGRVLFAATSEAWLGTVLDAGRGAPSPEIGARLAPTDRSAAVWGVGTLPPGAGDRLVALTGGQVKQPARAISFAVALGAGAPLAARLRIDMADAADAGKLAAFARGQLDLLTVAAQRYGLGRLLARTQISVEAAGVTLALRLDDNDVRLLEEALALTQEKKELGR